MNQGQARIIPPSPPHQCGILPPSPHQRFGAGGKLPLPRPCKVWCVTLVSTGIPPGVGFRFDPLLAPKYLERTPKTMATTVPLPPCDSCELTYALLRTVPLHILRAQALATSIRQDIGTLVPFRSTTSLPKREAPGEPGILRRRRGERGGGGGWKGKIGRKQAMHLTVTRPPVSVNFT